MNEMALPRPLPTGVLETCLEPGPDDVRDAHRLLCGYWRELKTDLTFDPAKALQNMRSTLHYGLGRIILLRDTLTRVPAAVAVVLYEDDWTVEKQAFLKVLFVAPPLRGTDTGRKLLRIAEDAARGDGAVVMWSNAPTFAPGHGRPFFNLLTRAGHLRQAGCTMKEL